LPNHKVDALNVFIIETFAQPTGRILRNCAIFFEWFHINSDPELENQINDRLSFKKLLQLPLDKPSPDYSTFSRFRTRLSKKAMGALKI
jgi:hypothetical protein